ncbi:Gram-positive pilin backbone subunit 2, Cna-B-like domain-containing protein [Bifidobacterium dolichotidis]|uniref:Gram-positive pilin backbone subunit 2, Cna-B-like domain-containing protein n=1 Tax=Bifidobacterium dolichotidis TaxID=2306976 RepID=A0A430FQE1_9BIFI|nr:isopeptide-forming domain-containing fimbrial protein [Bifidobacterium dolichotidis]RSX55059.1 Gram-positive pilin backbone subunit 2, Cna-B-like domain-containing protein [Bifidobacterium dolichotidis]
MNRVLKGTVAAVSGIAFALAGIVGASSAYADDASSTTTASSTPTIQGTQGVAATTTSTITVTNAQAGDMVAGYRLLNVESQSGDAFVYLVNATYKDAIISAINAINGDAAAPSTDAQIISFLTTKLNSSNVSQFATAFMSYKPAPTPTIAATDATKPISAQVGYYLLNQTVQGADTGKTISRFMVDTLGAAPLNVTLKNGTVSISKKVKQNTANTDNATWANDADYGLGETVPFQLTGTLPSTYDNFSTYLYTFTDTLPAGLTLVPGSEQVEAITNGQSTDITKDFTVSPADNQVSGAPFTMSCANLKTIAGLTADSQIVVTYNTTLNSNATVGNPGNINKANITFSSNPNVNDASQTETTPEATATVFTYAAQLKKLFQDASGKTVDTPTGDMPQFTMYASNGTTKVSGPVTVATNGDFSFNDLDTGTYVLKETHTPAGFNTADPITFTITATHGTDASTGAPTISALTVSQQGWTANANAGTISGTILNVKGGLLPSTGGMGTTLFYVFGSLLVAAAVAGMVFALRRRNA